jgi:hypothetical protein
MLKVTEQMRSLLAAGRLSWPASCVRCALPGSHQDRRFTAILLVNGGTFLGEAPDS